MRDNLVSRQWGTYVYLFLFPILYVYSHTLLLFLLSFVTFRFILFTLLKYRFLITLVSEQIYPLFNLSADTFYSTFTHFYLLSNHSIPSHFSSGFHLLFSLFAVFASSFFFYPYFILLLINLSIILFCYLTWLNKSGVGKAHESMAAWVRARDPRRQLQVCVWECASAYLHVFVNVHLCVCQPGYLPHNIPLCHFSFNNYSMKTSSIRRNQIPFGSFLS